jgi:hypothetical protein
MCQTNNPDTAKFGSYFDQWYEETSAVIHDHRFDFMNHA